MLCQSCNKNNATIHLTKIINGEVEEKHLCDSCAKDNKDFDFDFPFPLHKIFTGLLEISVGDEKEEPQFKKINCPECGLDYKRFMDTGKFGCAYCYKVFREDISILVKNIHGHSEHVGKIPIKSGGKILHKREVETLKKELDESIKVEDFETAAIIRDEIKKITLKIDQSGE